MTNQLPPETQSETFDLVLAYVLGNVTDEQRDLFDRMLASGDPEVTESYLTALNTLAELPRALTSAIPPAFVKDRIMSRVQEDSVAIAMGDQDAYRAPMPLLGRILGLIPGYSSSRAASFIPRLALRRRTLSFGFMLFGGLFASAYAFDQIAPMLRHSSEAQSQNVQRARAEHNSDVKTSQFSAFPSSIAQTQVTTSVDLGVAPSTTLAADPSISVPPLGSSPIAQRSEGARRPVVSSIAVSQNPAGTSEAMPVDMKNVEADFQFHAAPNAVHYTLTPVNGYQNGTAQIYWNPSRSDAFFSASDLQATTDDQRYVLYYTLSDGTMERMRGFTVVSAAQRSFLLRQSPNAQVTGAKLVLESGVNSGSPSWSTVLTATTKLTSK